MIQKNQASVLTSLDVTKVLLFIMGESKVGKGTQDTSFSDGRLSGYPLMKHQTC